MEAEHPTSKLSSLNERCPEQKLRLLQAGELEMATTDLDNTLCWYILFETNSGGYINPLLLIPAVIHQEDLAEVRPKLLFYKCCDM